MEIQVTVEEYVNFSEWIQGNVNVGGLVFDIDIDETLDLAHFCYWTFIDQIDDGLDIAEDFTPSHGPWCSISDGFALTELFGHPTRVRQTVLNVFHTAEISPVEVCFYAIEVVSGIDTHHIEIGENLDFSETKVQPVNVYDLDIDESFNAAFEQGAVLDITLKVGKTSTDLLNMRHSVVQEYFFNNSVNDQLFLYDRYTWGWYHKVLEGIGSTDGISEIIGKVVREYGLIGDIIDDSYRGNNLLAERFFTWDRSLSYWHHGVEEGIDFADALFDAISLLIAEEIIGTDASTGSPIYLKAVGDAINLRDLIGTFWDCDIDEEVGIADVAERSWDKVLEDTLLYVGLVRGDLAISVQDGVLLLSFATRAVDETVAESIEIAETC